MKNRRKTANQNKKGRSLPKSDDSDSNEDVGDIFTDEINDFTNERNQVQRDLIDQPSDSEDEEELFGLVDDDEEESDEEIGEWSKRLKQIKFQAKLDKKKPISDAPEKSWGNKRSDFYGSGVRRKPKEAESDEDDEWTMEEKEIEKLQQKLDEDLDEDDFLIPTIPQKKVQEKEQKELKIKRNLSSTEKEELRKKLHPEAEPLREELNKCLEELERLKNLTGWKVQSRDTCFRMLAANIAFYLHLIEADEDCRGHPVLKRIVQWKKLSKLHEAIPLEHMEASDEDEDNTGNESVVERRILGDAAQPSHSAKKPRLALEDSEEEDAADEDMDEGESLDPDAELDNRPITYEMEKNKQRKKAAPNNPRVKHREKFRKAKIRRRGQIREPKTEVYKYQGEASGIRAGITRSIKFK
ncbi:something about silencing protein 10 [Plakobranchus ocellatus]|uniref:Something about silencing protein 10 n=1 Tax=Plakobranchus ocellatus TaxID=259542 RepID=A0AAV4A4B3_9GAST|nr:something about silencing protein 10 [Plakobranchus ocellatus]